MFTGSVQFNKLLKVFHRILNCVSFFRFRRNSTTPLELLVHITPEVWPSLSESWECSIRHVSMNSGTNQWNSVVVCGPDESFVSLRQHLDHDSFWLQLNHLHNKVVPDRDVSDGRRWGPVAHTNNVVTNKGNPSSQGTFSIWAVLLLWLALPVCRFRPYKETWTTWILYLKPVPKYLMA